MTDQRSETRGHPAPDADDVAATQTYEVLVAFTVEAYSHDDAINRVGRRVRSPFPPSIEDVRLIDGRDDAD